MPARHIVLTQMLPFCLRFISPSCVYLWSRGVSRRESQGSLQNCPHFLELALSLSKKVSKRSPLPTVQGELSQENPGAGGLVNGALSSKSSLNEGPDLVLVGVHVLLEVLFFQLRRKAKAR